MAAIILSILFSLTTLLASNAYAATITPIPTPSFFPPFPTLTIPNKPPACMAGLSKDETIYPPNSACYAETKRTQLNIKTYPKTCIKEPLVSYNDIRGITDKYGYDNCSGKDGHPCDIYITVTTDISKAELGSYGPSYSTITTKNIDKLSQTYLFNSFFDRPYFTKNETPREAWRTYWRMMPFQEQANLISQFLNLVKLDLVTDSLTLKKINNTKYQFVDQNGKTQEMTASTLYGLLPKCLITQPVCPDFAKAYNKLNPFTRAAYDTLIPLSFNNLRGFIALNPPSFPPRPAVPKTVSRESIPYIETIFAGLLSKRFGLMANIQPDWLITQTTSGLTDTNTAYDTSTGKDNYLPGQFSLITNKFGDKDMDVTVLDNADIVACPTFPNVYNISAPRTFPKSQSNTDPYHVQEIKIRGSSLNWQAEDFASTKEEHTSCNAYGHCTTTIKYSCPSPSEFYPYPDTCRQYRVTGSGTGKALTVFNNPKTTDIKNAVVQDTKTSLYNTLIPDSLLTPTPTDKKIDAPTSTHANIKTEYTGNSAVKNPENSIIRENNLAQDTAHLLQNCWTVPSNLQQSPKCGNLPIPRPGLDSNVDCDQTVPDQNIPGVISKEEVVRLADMWVASGNPAKGKHHARECYNDVVKRAAAAGVNINFALLIWLNESNASNYDLSVEDFGIHRPSNPVTGFSAQINAFLQLPDAYRGRCSEDNLLSFSAIFLTGKCPPSDQATFYYNNTVTVWTQIMGLPLSSLPTWPK